MSQEGKMSVRNVTKIGCVQGQVHSGSGHINVAPGTLGTALSPETHALLREVATGLKAFTATSSSTDEKAVRRAATAVQRARREARSARPRKQKIVENLQAAKGVIVATNKVATSVGAAAGAGAKLVALLNTAVETIGSAFR